MKTASFFYLLLVFLFIIPCKCDSCGNMGEDYYNLNKFQYSFLSDFTNASSPNWIFTPFNYWANETLMNSACQFTSNSCEDLNYGECELFDFQFIKTYDFACKILDVSATQQMINELSGLLFGEANDTDCFCEIPATPRGKYINGITIEVRGMVQFATVSLTTNPCSVKVSYQNTPLKIGDQFTQQIILNGKKHQARWWVPRLVIVVVSLTVLSSGFAVIGVIIERRKRNNNNNHYIKIDQYGDEEEEI